MAKKTLLPGYKSLGGKSQRVLTPTGEEISRRQYAKIARENSSATPIVNGKKVTSNEALAKLNKALNPEKFFAKPARGRSSLGKIDSDAQAKALAKKRAEERAEAEKQMRLDIEAQRLENLKKKRLKKVANKKAKKFSVNSLTPGRLAFQRQFYSYFELETLLYDAQRSNKVFAYALGISGFDERSGKPLDAMLTGLQDFSVGISEEMFDEMVNDFLIEKSYFVFTNYFVHFSFKKEYAEAKAAKYGLKLGQRKKK